MAEISSASKEQADGISQVTIAVSEMDTVVQQNAAGSEELSSQADELRSKVGIMLEIVEGEKSNRTVTTIQPKAKRLSSLKSNKMVAHDSKEVRPDQVIPFDEDEKFEDF